LRDSRRVPVKIIGGEGKPADGQVEIKELPKHKKNDQVGTKKTYYSETIFVEQADAASFAQDEEVSSHYCLFTDKLKKRETKKTIDSSELAHLNGLG
jgi:hypothetical protein